MYYTLFVIGIIGVTQASKIKVTDDGGYEDIVIKIEDDVPEADCPNILRGIENLLQESSNLFIASLPVKAYFRSAIVVVPSSWSDDTCGLQITSPRSNTPYQKADFIIDRPPNTSQPFAHQSAGCGQQGDFLSIPSTFLRNTNVTEEDTITFVQQWLKYRYGVFDDLEISDDKSSNNNEIKESKHAENKSQKEEVIEVVIHNGSESDGKKNKETLFDPNSYSKGIACSLELDNRFSVPKRKKDTYCNEVKHYITPTTQEVLCNGRTASDVISSHEDFTGSHDQQKHQKNITPQLKIVRQPSPKYVLIFQTSTLKNIDHWRWIEKAASKFIRFDVPGNTFISILTYAGAGQTGTVTIEHPLVQVTSDAVRSELADTIPGKYHLSTEQESCAGQAVKTAVEEVLQGGTAGAHIILVSSDRENCASAEDQEIILKYVTMNNFKLSTINLYEMHHKQFYYHISQISGGRSFHIPAAHYQLDMLDNLNFAFSQILRDDKVLPTEQPITVHKADFYNSESNTSSGSFVIDETLGRETMLGVYVEDDEDHLIKSIQLTDSGGNKYGPFTKMSSTFDLVNLKTINYVGRAPPFGDMNLLAQRWQYSIEWYPTETKTRKSILMVTSKPKTTDKDQLVKVKVWTSHEHPQSGLWISHLPLAVYAEVMIGHSPVINASAFLHVEMTNNNGTIFSMLPIQMFDNGYGEPDLNANDGIYSIFLTSFPSTGDYRLTVHVESDRNAKYKESHLIQQIPSEQCCEENNKLAKEVLLQSKIFTRKIVGPSFYIKNITSEDKFPPSKIIDLSVEKTDLGSLILHWTSPGGDFLSGTVAGYKVVSSFEISDMIEKPQMTDVVISLNRTHIAGVANTVNVNISYYDQYYFIGVVAIDKRGNAGKMSNLVFIFQPSEKDMETFGNEMYQPLVDDKVSETEWMILGVVCGVLLVSTIIIMAILTYCYCQQQPVSTNTSQENIAYYGDTDASDDTQSEFTHDETLDAELKKARAYQKGQVHTKYEDFAEPLNGKNLFNVNINGLTVLNLQSGHCEQELSPYWLRECHGDVPSPYIMRSSSIDNSSPHTYLTMCDKDFKSEPSPYLSEQEGTDYNGPPPYSLMDTKAYFTNIQNYLVPRMTKHSTVV